MSLDGVNGFLDVESAALRAPQVGIANTNPQHILSVGSNLYVSGDSSDVLTVDGNVVCEGVKVGLIEIIPSYDLEAVANVGNSTSNTILFTNPDTGFVATGNATIGKTLTVSGFRITATAEANDDLAAITAAGADTSEAIHITNATNSTSPLTGALRLGTNTIFSGLGVSGNVHVGQSLVVDTDTLFVDSTTDRVGIGKTDPATPLDVDGTVTATTFVGALAADQITGTLAVASGGTGTTTSTGTGSVVRSIAPTFTGTTTFSGEVDVTGNMSYTKPASILVDSNVVTEYTGPHGRDGAATLKKYPEIIFEEGKFDRNDTTNTYVQAGYTVTASSQQSTQQAWKAFDENNSGTPPAWLTVDPSYNGSTYLGSKNLGTATGGNSTTVPGEYIILQMPNKVKLKHFKLKERFGHSGSAGDRAPAAGKIYGSNDGTYWSEVNTFSGLTYTDDDDVFTTVNVNSSIAYNRFALVVTAINVSQDDWVGISDLRYYGYEEDPPAGDTSIDTTFTSIMNTPQTTGANVYTDAKLSSDFTNQVTGPTPVGTAAVHDNTNKYWEMNGQLTSNITVEANTFLEGDQPHAVSVWFNSSNLEANVSNTCVFSVSDQEKLDSVNLDLQSNTWHNLTYAYQGEGGSRVTYLDGRKVAEDRAEDTFGEYPPFAMTGYSQGGYVVSASGELSSTDNSHNIFDKDLSNSSLWTPSASGYDASTGAANTTGSITLTDGVQGHWVQLDLPHKLKLNYVGVAASSIGTRYAKDATIFGSNDGVSWTSVGGWTDNTHASNTLKYFSMNGVSGYYNKYRMVVTKNGPDAALTLTELKLYGHRENDLVRLPDPTNVLKYPHIAFPNSDGPAGQGSGGTPSIRGYVATTDDANPSYPIGKAFDGIFSDPAGANVNNQARWQPTNQVYASGNDTTGGATTTLANGTTYKGNYMQLESPHKLNVTKYKIYSGTYLTDYRPSKVVMLGSNTGGSDWVDLGSGETTLTYSGTNADYAATVSISNTSTYKYHRLVIRAVASQSLPVVYQLEFYGTEENSSIPIQIGGGNIDRVANFRVYDKFIGEDQALEIWDAQKDEFERAKSSMTLQKGRLGIGTDEPEGRLAVLDEPHNLEEFPPRAMSGYKNYFEGHGEFCVYASTDYVTTNHAAWKSFNKSTGNGWHTNGSNYVSGVYNAGKSLGGISGDYLVLKLPYKINLKSIAMAPRDGLPQRGPGSGVILGSNDEVNWEQVHSFSGITYTDNVYTTIDAISSTKTYNVFAMVVTNLAGTGVNTDYLNLAEWKLFGTREQGQSVLHDGQLTLTKSLNVPRIGPALDADDTPRRDRLIAEYNTSTNPTFEGAVRDTSGRGNDGVFYGGASYDATEKALVFDGTVSDQYVHTLKNGTSESGNINYSVSLWFNPTTVNVARWRAIFAIGVLDRTQPTDNNGDEITLFVNNGTNALHLQNGGSSVNTGALNAGQWVHIVVTYDGTNRKIYLDGSLSVSNGYTSLNLPKEMLIRLAQSIPSGGSEIDEYMDCKISNFKAWFGAALTAEEVKTLYDMGRCDEGHHVVNFSKTRVGIGLGDGEAPQAALDVRGNISATGIIRSKRPMWSAGHQPGTSTVLPTMPSTTGIVFEDLNYDHTGNYSTSTGRFTVPVSGYYFIGTRALVYVPSDTARVDVDVAKVRINGTTTRVIQGERLAGTQGGRATSLNISVQISGTVYLVEGEQVYPRYQSTGTTTYVVTIDNDFNEFWGFLIEQV